MTPSQTRGYAQLCRKLDCVSLLVEEGLSVDDAIAAVASLEQTIEGYHVADDTRRKAGQSKEADNRGRPS
jgi:hypothetical protein